MKKVLLLVLIFTFVFSSVSIAQEEQNVRYLNGVEINIVPVKKESPDNRPTPKGNFIQDLNKYPEIKLLLQRVEKNSCGNITDHKVWVDEKIRPDTNGKEEWYHDATITIEITSSGTCTKTDDNRSGSNKGIQTNDDNDLALEQHVRSTHDRYANNSGDHAYVIKETRGWWTRTDIGVDENWYAKDVRLAESVVGYYCDTGDDAFDVTRSSYFNPEWYTTKRSYDYFISPHDTMKPVIPLEPNQVKMFSGVESDYIYKGNTVVDQKFNIYYDYNSY